MKQVEQCLARGPLVVIEGDPMAGPPSVSDTPEGVLGGVMAAMKQLQQQQVCGACGCVLGECVRVYGEGVCVVCACCIQHAYVHTHSHSHTCTADPLTRTHPLHTPFTHPLHTHPLYTPSTHTQAARTAADKQVDHLQTQVTQLKALSTAQQRRIGMLQVLLGGLDATVMQKKVCLWVCLCGVWGVWCMGCVVYGVCGVWGVRGVWGVCGVCGYGLDKNHSYACNPLSNPSHPPTPPLTPPQVQLTAELLEIRSALHEAEAKEASTQALLIATQQQLQVVQQQLETQVGVGGGVDGGGV